MGPGLRRPAEAGYLQVPDGQLYYELAGHGDETLVLIHGNAGDRRHWDAQFPALADSHRVVRYDVRGFGNSSLPAEGKPYSDREDLQSLCDQLGIDSAHMVGWSMGSGIALDFVLEYPSRARSLVTVGPWVFGYDSELVRRFLGDLRVISKTIRAQGAAVGVDAWMNSACFAASVCDASAGAAFRRIAADYSWWAMLHASQQRPLEPDATMRLGAIGVPVLIVTAEHDIPACRETAALLDEAVPRSTKIVMEGTGHLLHMEKADLFNELVVSFVGEASGT